MTLITQAKAKTTIAVFSTQQGEKTGRTITAGTVFPYLVKNGTWLQLSNGDWVNAGATWQYIELLTQVTTPPPPPTDPPATDPTVTHIVRYNQTGQISVDGLPYE